MCTSVAGVRKKADAELNILRAVYHVHYSSSSVLGLINCSRRIFINLMCVFVGCLLPHSHESSDALLQPTSLQNCSLFIFSVLTRSLRISIAGNAGFPADFLTITTPFFCDSKAFEDFSMTSPLLMKVILYKIVELFQKAFVCFCLLCNTHVFVVAYA